MKRFFIPICMAITLCACGTNQTGEKISDMVQSNGEETVVENPRERNVQWMMKELCMVCMEFIYI